jgi:hypothetical protein
VLQGAAQPASVAEGLELARLAHRTRHHAAAAGLYARAFAEEPALAEQGDHRYEGDSRSKRSRATRPPGRARRDG